jgi:hypothetical protein
MHRSWFSIGCPFLCASLFASPAFAGRDPVRIDPSTPVVLSVRIISTAKDVGKTVPLMIDEADSLWRRYGVRLTRGDGASPQHVQIVIVDDPLPGSFRDGEGDRGLGWITFLTPETPRNVIYLSWNRTVKLFSELPGVKQPLEHLPDSLRIGALARALGRTLAHEVGHYVFSSTDHARVGMMRRNYSAFQLFERDAGPFRLDSDRERALKLAVDCAQRQRS